MARGDDGGTVEPGLVRRLARAGLHNKAARAVGFAAALLSLIGGAIGLWHGGSHARSPAENVRDCIAQHGLERARDVIRRGASTRVYASCVWPAPPWADADGYSEIVVRFRNGPGQFEASGTTLADRIGTPCSELEVAYTFGSQGDFERHPPLDLVRGSIVTDDGQIWRGDPRTLPFYPDRDEIVVLHNTRSRLDYARCLSAA